MKTFAVQTLGCKVNQYEGEQIAALLRSRGLVETDAAHAELRVVNTCSVTVQAGSKSRQTARRNVRLPLLGDPSPTTDSGDIDHSIVGAPSAGNEAVTGRRPRVVLTGCWATSDRQTAAAMPGVDAVLTHRDDVAAELDRLLLLWRSDEANCEAASISAEPHAKQRVALEDTPDSARTKVWDGWMERAGSSEAGERTVRSKSILRADVNVKPASAHATGSGAPSDHRRTGGRDEREEIREADVSRISPPSSRLQPEAVAWEGPRAPGTTRLPLLGSRQTGRQRALLKVQDGCDAHCTYCIIPKLRPNLWSKPIDDAVREARNLVSAGHVEIVLNGIFLGAFGQPTALRRRQPGPTGDNLGRLVEALCTRVSGLLRLRLSSLEPGDLTEELLRVLRSHPQVVPHFHLPLQSGSVALLRRMNRQYSRDDFLRMADRVCDAFDRPALTTDIIVGFPGETEEEFERTLEVVDHCGFIHVHAFSFSPRPGTAAARWTKDFVRGPVVNERIERLTARAAMHSELFRRSFLGETVELLVERDDAEALGERHGRCERWFGVRFSDHDAQPGDRVTVRINRVSGERTEGTLVSRSPRP
jgi:threonylcarbamoyladenosine tRNA methylthiotransferase MtaB